jgi:hypothetical protein
MSYSFALLGVIMGIRWQVPWREEKYPTAPRMEAILRWIRNQHTVQGHFAHKKLPPP